MVKHKEALKKLILKKRDILEKELQVDIQKELAEAMSTWIKDYCAKQQEGIVDKKEPSKYMKKK